MFLHEVTNFALFLPPLPPSSGYCFVNLRSAVEFILTLDGTVLNMDEAEFNSKLAAAEEAWETKHTC